MPLTVVSCCTYLTGAGAVGWRRVDYDAHDFVLAVKDRAINGSAHVPCGGALHRIEDRNRDLSLDLFAQIVAADVAGHVDLGLTRPVILVPIPNSATDVRASAPPRTSAQAAALARRLGSHANVADVLRWRARMLSARAGGGPRDPQSLFDELVLCGDRQPTLGACGNPSRVPVVLVDDVVTSGGHVQAAAAALRDRGFEVSFAVVAGRSVRAQVDRPFAVRVETLPDFVPERLGALRSE